MIKYVARVETVIGNQSKAGMIQIQVNWIDMDRIIKENPYVRLIRLFQYFVKSN
jgi:hypothetical protein